MAENKLEFSQVPYVPKHIKLRFMVGVDGPEQCYNELNDHLTWRQEALPAQVTSRTAQLLDSGFIYIHGRDRCFRPLLIINPLRLDQLGIKDEDEKIEAVLNTTAFILEYMI